MKFSAPRAKAILKLLYAIFMLLQAFQPNQETNQKCEGHDPRAPMTWLRGA